MIRDPRRPPRDNYTGLVPMARCRWKGIPFELMLEMDWLLVTDAFLRALCGIDAQPCIIEYFFDGKHRKSICGLWHDREYRSAGSSSKSRRSWTSIRRTPN